MIELVLTKDNPEIKNPVVNDTLHEPGGSLEESIVKVLKPLGGLSNFVSKNDNIILKPNFNTGDPFPASTDPDFLISVLQLILKQTSNVQIAESSTLRANTKEIIENKLGEKLRQLDIPVITEKEFKYTRIDLKSLGAKYLKSVKLPEQVLDPHAKIILLPCLKTHLIARYTGALKLAVGFMEKKQRVRMHMSFHVTAKIAELNLGYKPDLIIMDARKIFVTKGPASGRVESPMRFLSGTNRVAIDIEGVRIIQSYHAKNRLGNKDPMEIGTIKRALELGIDEN